MIKESDFLALVAAAGDLDDLRNNQCFVFRRPAESRKFARIWRAGAADGDSTSITKAKATLEGWVRSCVTGGLKLRDSSKLPEWTPGLRRMFVHISRPIPKQQGSLTQRLVEPAMEYGRAELRRRLKRQEYSSFSPGIVRCFEKQLENRLTQAINSCLEFELKVFEAAFRCVFRTQGELGRDEIEREFIGGNAGARMIKLLQSYPALAKLWSQVIQNWVEKISELATRLEADQSAIWQVFFRGRNPGNLVGITMNISDPHWGGRETMLLRFRNGEVVYKPRSGRSESDWFSFLTWINRQGFTPTFRILRLLRRSGYCWMEFVKARPCRREIEAHFYYRRAGGLICAAYLLGAVDCHRDNLIASGGQPVLIDTETLLHPEALTSTGDRNGRSVIRTGILPIPRSLSRSRTDLSALGGGPGKHTPTLGGKLLASTHYSAEVLDGFRDMWKLIGDSRSRTRAAFCRRLRRLTDRSWRRIHLSTRSYLEICDRSLDPNALRSGLGRSQSMARDLLRRGVSASVILEEISALGRLDIPHFLEMPEDSLAYADSYPLSNLISRVRSTLHKGRTN